MPILNVHEVGEERVGSQTLDEVLLGLLEGAFKDLLVYLVERLSAST